MLHGDVMVNGSVIGVWTAVRQQHPPGETNDYKCTIKYRNLDGFLFTADWMLTDFPFGDGAIALASRVLSEGLERARLSDRDAAVAAMTTRFNQGG